MEEEVARQRAKDKGQLKEYWAYKPYKANWPYQKEKKFGFNNTELINLVLIMFPAGSH